jgi:hypothetical protein
MKILKTILIVVVILIAIPFIIAIFVAKDYSIQREVVINEPKKEVFNYVKHIKNQDEYNVWTMADPNMKKTYSGTDGTVGFVYSWNGNDQVGEGEQELISIKEGERVDMELRFKRPFESKGYAFMETENANGGTKVTWGMKGHNPYPMNFMNIFMGSTIGSALEDGLTNMKNNLEK